MSGSEVDGGGVGMESGSLVGMGAGSLVGMGSGSLRTSLAIGTVARDAPEFGVDRVLKAGNE